MLRAVTLLGDNTVPILGDLCRHLVASGVAIEPDPRPPPRSTEAAARAEGADLIWGCGYLMCELIDAGRLDAEIVAAPVFEGQTEPVYHSVIVAADPRVRSLQDAAGRTLAINEPVSWSGHLALVRHLAAAGHDLSLFGSVVETGSHRGSVDAVACGDAAVASIDHTIWEHLGAHGQIGDAVRVIDRTADWPAPPIAVHRRVAPTVRRTIEEHLERLPDATIGGLHGTVRAARRDYAVMAPAVG